MSALETRARVILARAILRVNWKANLALLLAAGHIVWDVLR